MSYLDEGYIKFECIWKQKNAIDYDFSELIHWRKKMWKKKWIGFYEEYNVGFGNISEKKNNLFLISGTQTGHLENLTSEHFTKITNYNIEKNLVECSGPSKASSETMTHAVIYEQNPTIKAIIHIHSKSLWEKLLFKIPTTNKNVPYGTPEMAHEIVRLFNETKVAELKILAMAGHEEGIIAFGTNLAEAANILEHYEN